MKKPRRRSLRGNTVVLLGGAIDEGHPVELDEIGEIHDDPIIRQEEAVIALARAVFARGGRLALRYDLSFTPLVIQVANEYLAPALAEGFQERFPAPVLIFGGPEEWELSWHDYLQRTGFSTMSDVHQLFDLRPSHVFYVGGGPETGDDLEHFRQAPNGARVVVFPSTGGRAAAVVQEARDYDFEGRIWNTAAARRSEQRFSPPGNARQENVLDDRAGREIPEFRASIYPLLVALALDDEI
jgi:hypothetical protein